MCLLACSHKTAPLPSYHVFSLITTIFKLVLDIHITNAKHVTSREKGPPGGHVFLPIQTIIELNLWSPSLTQMNQKNAPPLGHVFQAKFQEDRKINVASRVLTRKNSPPPGGHVFQPTDIIFKLVQDIIGMNLLTKFYEDRTINVASRVKNALPLSSHVFQANVTIFELIQDIIENNLRTKFHEDRTINVASRE
ncbi:hypothetical protein DPMN_084087 [Dreissena polymorpha]|uniref:Uncharacterized protein n=1 Tax=Dreissena polymorpha TaxID=45954 RepID=A0A9D3YD75_DREPO|nr:hypothetical protein DPMN_084087 [Dreissena polymorpha]